MTGDNGVDTCGGLEELGAGGELLRNHAGDGDHRDAPVVELLRLHFHTALRVRRVHVHWGPSQNHRERGRP